MAGGPAVIDSLSRHRPGTRFETDLCVVGAGPAGLAVAEQFLDTEKRVLLVESGGEKPRVADQQLNAGRVAGAPFTGLERGRVRAFGGTSWTWAGQCSPLDESALDARPWVEGSRWPLPAGTVEGYTRRALAFFGLDGPEPSWSATPALDDRLLRLEVSRFAHPSSLGPARLPTFRRSRSLTAMLHATVTRLRLSPSRDHVAEVEISSLDGVHATVAAGAFVLCCGAIENARLLLLCDELQGRLPALGRYLQDHLLARAASLEPLDRRALHEQFARVRRRRRTGMRRLALAGEEQRRARVLACHGYVGWSPPRTPTSPAGVRDAAVALARRARGLSSAPRSGDMWLELRAEQAPDPASRVRLARATDVLGCRQVEVDWRIGDTELRTMRAMVDAVSRELRRLGLAIVHPAGWLGDGEGWRAEVGDAFHPAGTTRMSEDPADGVVDPACRVHGIDNLYVVGSSVFPASGAANPTLGVVALSLRLADQLRRRGVDG